VRDGAGHRLRTWFVSEAKFFKRRSRNDAGDQ
jgi:hypothetical protein